MELSGEHRIAAARKKVWEALNDPEVLKACIPGCESLTQDGADAFDAVVHAKVGPVRTRFSGSVKLSNIHPPESYTITGEGKGGVAGMAKGGADVFLKEDGDGTLLRYTVKAEVGGKLAQIGSRLIQSAANRYANDFFSRFGDIVTGARPPPQPVAATGPTAVKSALPATTTTTSAPAAAMTTASAANVAASGGQVDQNMAHIRRLNWALLAIIVGLIAYIVVGR